MKNELVIKHNLDIQSNMEELSVKIQKDIKEKYDLIVTDESVLDTKKIMSEINREKDEFKKKYKEFKTLVLSPFVPLDNKAKEIESYFDKARTALDIQVKKFEEGKREQSKKVCIEYAQEQCELKNIDIATITISDLFNKLGSVTSANNISSGAKKEIDARIIAVELAILKAKQEEEEKLKREREIAENARIAAEEKSKQREKEIIEQAEKDKEAAVKKALEDIKKPEPAVILEPIKTVTMSEPEIEPIHKTKTFKLILDKEKYFKFYEFLKENKIEFEEI